MTARDERGGGTAMGQGTETGHHAHPAADVYVRVFFVLGILTVLEVGVFYVPAFHPVLVPVLLVLSAAKFTLVVMFYMHLKADSRFFTFLFGAPLMLAVVVMIALMFIFYGTLTLRGAAGAG
jgi:cytochrome c oxidase subunit IV